MVVAQWSNKVNARGADDCDIVVSSHKHVAGSSRTCLFTGTSPLCFPCAFSLSLTKRTLRVDISKPSSIVTASSPRRVCLHSTVDEDGYLCSSRAARELALSILYAALLLGEKPIRVFRDRLRQQSGYFAKEQLIAYKHAPDTGGPIVANDALSAKKLENEQLEESMLEAAVLSAPPSKVYRRSILKMAEEIIEVTANTWSEHDLILSELMPKSWKERKGHASIQQCILHMSMAEMTRCGTPPKVVIHEAVQLGLRFTDMRSARVINGCLGSFMESAHYTGGHE